MALRDELEAQGNWLFRWRSYLPLALILPLLVVLRDFHWPMHSSAVQEIWENCCLVVSFSGLLVRVLTVAHAPPKTSGRNTRQQVARTLNTTGMYSIVRHPLYLGNFLMWLGLAMFYSDWRLLMIFVLCFWLYYERIMFAEEEFLRNKFSQNFVDWAARTPAFFPRLSNWQPSCRPFSLRKVLGHEYHGLFGLVVAFVCLEAGEHLAVEHNLPFERFWVVFGTFGLGTYLVLLPMKKRTSLLSEKGR